MSYRIGSLNLLRSDRDEEQRRLFHGFINDVIHDEGLDIFAFQEVSKKNVIDEMLRNLPRWWTGAHVVGSEFAFIWDTNRVEECSKHREPKIFREYKSSLHLKREPLYGRFSPKYLGSNNEFRLIDIHLEHGGKDDYAAIIHRKDECELSKDKIYQTIDTHRYGNFKRAFTLILGDYNLDCERCNECKPQNIRTFQAEKTTLKKTFGYSQSYDHFSFNLDKNSSVPFSASRIDAVNKYFGGEFIRYQKTVSDHVPIKIEVF